MFRIALKGVLARKARLFLTSIAVVLGTAFLSGTYIFSDTLTTTFDQLFADIYKNTDGYVRSSKVIDAGFGQEERQLIPISTIDLVRKIPGVSGAAGNIQAFARIIGKDGKPLGKDGIGPPTFGSSISNYKGELWKISKGVLPTKPDELAMDDVNAKKAKFQVGDSVKVVAAGGSRMFKLVGIARHGDVRSPGGATFALFDINTASEFLVKSGFIDSVLLQSDGTLSDEELAVKITAALPTDLDIETLTGAQITQETQDGVGQRLSFFATLLSVFSFIALGVGCFVIYNVFSITAAQRQRENALFRAIGASKRQITQAMLIEAIAVGIIGSVTGLFAGVLLAQGLSGVLRVTGIDLPPGSLVFAQHTVVTVLIVGMVVTVISAIMPALRAGKVPPLAAMRSTALDTAGSIRRRVMIAAAFAASGFVVLLAVIRGADNVLLGIAILLVFIAVLIAGPAVARPVSLFIGRPAARLRGITGAMARQNAARNPKRTSRTAAPVLIGVALVMAVTVLASTIRAEITDIFSKQFTGDFTINADDRFFGGFNPSLADDINALPGVQRASGFGVSIANVSLSGKSKSKFVTVIDPQTIDGIFDIGLIAISPKALTKEGIFISQKAADKNSLILGSTIAVELSDGSEHDLIVQGIYVRDQLVGGYTVSRQLFEGTVVSRFDAAIFVLKKDGVKDSDIRTSLTGVINKYGTGKLLSKSEYIKKQASQVNQLLGLIYGLLFLSVIIAIVGIIITLLLSVHERQREIGLMRAVGMTKSQVRTTVRWESVITSLLGAVMGILLGLGLGWVVIFSLRDQGIKRFTVPTTGTFVILILSFIIGVIAAAYPAHRATKVDLLAALAMT
ncbi:MAG: FtsX-like permease family protein [Ilumatobacteraceae bacterium]|nr:FtsX-like permease family protein [Ilumatobacteraceae bacterium]